MFLSSSSSPRGCLYEEWVEGIAESPHPTIAEVLQKLRAVYALNELKKHEAVLAKHGAKCLDRLNAAMAENFEKIRGVALDVIEAFSFDDQTLNSYLGRRDGKVYSEMMWQAKYLNPVNKHKVFPPMRQLMRPKL